MARSSRDSRARARPGHEAGAVSYTHLDAALASAGVSAASVSPGAVERMVEDLRREGRRNIAYRVYPRLDHGLRDVDGASRMGEVADDMAAWLRDLPAR